MKLQQVFVKKVREVETRYGQKVVIDAIDCGKELTIWRNAGDSYALGLFSGDAITVEIDSKGKVNLVVPTEETTAITVKAQHLETKPITPAIHPHVAKMAQIMAQCVAAIRNELPGLDAESEQKYATSLFIQASREII